MAVIKLSDYTKTSSNTSSTNVDLNSVDKNNADQLEIKNFANASTNTVLSKTSNGLTYMPIKADGNGNYTKLASIEYLQELVQGSLQFMGTWTPLANNPDITTITVPSGASYFWICDNAGTFTLNSKVYTFVKFDWIVKKSDGTYIQLNKSSDSVLWTGITGTITDNADLVNYVKRFANVQSITATGSVNAWKSIVVVDCSSSDVVITLPTSTNIYSQDILITRIDSVANLNKVVIQPFAGEQLNNSINNTITLNRNGQTTSFVCLSGKVYSETKPSSANSLLVEKIATSGNKTLNTNTEYHITNISVIGSVLTLPSVANDGDTIRFNIALNSGLNYTQSKTFSITGNINGATNNSVICNANSRIFEFNYDSTVGTWTLKK